MKSLAIVLNQALFIKLILCISRTQVLDNCLFYRIFTTFLDKPRLNNENLG